MAKTPSKELKKVHVLIVFYTFSGAVAELARWIGKGTESVANTTVELKQVPELLSKDFFDKNEKLRKVREKMDKEFPIATIDDLVNADAVAFGTPTHFGSFASQMKQFIDQLTPAWLKGKLINKPAAVFCAAGSMHGGEELTLLSLMIPLLNLGMIPIGIPYPIQGVGPDFESGSPYGAIYVSGNNRKFSEGDKKVAKILGIRLATMAHLLNCGCESCGMCHDLRQEIK